MRELLLFAGIGLLCACTTTKGPAPLRDEAVKPAVAENVEPATYTVRRGDTLSAIAFRFEMSTAELVRLNRLDNPNTIYVGQILRLREDGGAPAGRLSRAAEQRSATGQIPTKSLRKTVKTQPLVVDAPPKTDAADEMDLDDKKQVTKWIWPANGRVVSQFSTGGQGSKGINIAGTQGEPVLAAADGRVVYSGSGVRGYGQLIIIKHNNEFLSAYAHNSRIYVQENQTVKAGQRIADMGNTGTETTQLHFEIRYREKPVDPLKYLPKR